MRTVGCVEVANVSGKGESTGGSILLAGRVALERLKARGCIPDAKCVEIERADTGRGVTATVGVIRKRSPSRCRVRPSGRVGKERVGAAHRVVHSGCIVKEGIKTDRRVAGAGCEAEKCIRPLSGIAAGISSIGWWGDRLNRL
jgi:hypothetical protein